MESTNGSYHERRMEWKSSPIFLHGIASTQRKVAQKSLLHAKPFEPSGGLTEHVTKMERLCLR
jgi:hypothetical protein